MAHSGHHEQFLETGTAAASVRSMVADSWMRSAAAGVDPDANLTPVVLEHADLVEYRSAHPLAQVFPVLWDVLGRAAQDSDCVLAIGDADGTLLWVCGAPDILRSAESIHFVEGAAWDEHHAGTNAPGTAIHLDQAVQIKSAEHFNRLVQPWSCSAAPIHHPFTREILGLVDVTGGPDVASPQTLGMIRAAARLAESELARAGDRSEPTSGELWSPSSVLLVRGLGRSECQASLGRQTYHLSPRHSEILIALVDHPEGLTAEELEVEIYPTGTHSSTMRAEMARLRALLGPHVLQSRPYRLSVETDCDWQAVSAHLAAGRIRDAIRAYRGPLLPQSEAPGIERRRDLIQRQLRAAILASGQPDLMVSWTGSRWGADDAQMWLQQSRTLPASSPLRPLAAAEAARLDAELRQ
jgi:GAF domain